MNEKKVFLAMPFSTRHDKILETIRQAARTLGANLIKLDELAFTGSVVEKMRSQISESDMMVAIVTEENGNVYYEIGLAHCQNIPVLLVTNDAGALKFDLKDHRAIIYDDTQPEKVFHELVEMLRVTLAKELHYPHDYFANVFGRDPKAATELGRKKVVASLQDNANLQEPIDIEDWRVLPNGELAVTVSDYMGTCVRAVFDRNGYLKRSKKD